MIALRIVFKSICAAIKISLLNPVAKVDYPLPDPRQRPPTVDFGLLEARVLVLRRIPRNKPFKINTSKAT